MTRGTRRGQGASDRRRGFRGASEVALRQAAHAGKREAGTAVSVVPPSQDALRAAIAAQTCPFCDRGPFRMLPVHTNKVHGVDKWELREMAGLSTNDPLCAEGPRAKMSEAAKRNGTHVLATEASKNRRAQRWTAAGRRRVAGNLAAWTAENEEEAERIRRIALAASMTPEARAKQSASLRVRLAANPPSEEKVRAFVERMQSPEVAAKRGARRIMPDHGSTARYKRGCRCEDCRRAKAMSRKRAKEA